MDDIEELILAKHEIDTYMINNKSRNKKQSLDDFFTYISEDYRQFFYTNKNNKTNVLTYTTKHIGNTYYFFVTRENDDTHDAFSKKINDIINENYNSCDEIYIAQNNIKEYLLINNQFLTFRN